MKFIIKPVFVAWSTLVSQLPFQIFFTVWAGGFFGGIFQQFLMKEIQLPITPFVFIGGLAFILFPLVIFVLKKLNYQKTEYRFFDAHLEFEEGFFTINKKVVKYLDIKEATLREGILQRVNGLGTIYLGTLTTGSAPFANPFSALGFGNTSASGITIKDIANPNQEYERIREIIDSVKNKSS